MKKIFTKYALVVVLGTVFLLFADNLFQVIFDGILAGNPRMSVVAEALAGGMTTVGVTMLATIVSVVLLGLVYPDGSHVKFFTSLLATITLGTIFQRITIGTGPGIFTLLVFYLFVTLFFFVGAVNQSEST